MAEKWVPIRDLDVFFLSFDEADADAHFADLRQKHPAAKRIHGIKGFDRAHKAAASASRTEHFITVDADNIVDPSFFELCLDAAVLQPRTIVSWPARNVVNGILSGNGAIKCWPRGYVLAMRTHENAEGDEGQVDFVYNTDLGRPEGSFPWDEPAPMSTVHGNATPVQAFRAGFRAASRLTLVNGRPCLAVPGHDAIWPTNRHRLDLWLNVGADAPNGRWTIYGARLGCWLVNFADLPITVINDLDWFDRYFADEITPRFGSDGALPSGTASTAEDERLAVAIAEAGDRLARRSGLEIAELSPAQSAFFKQLYQPPPLTGLDRMGTMLRRGLGVAPDPGMAAAYYTAAAACGERNAIYNLARQLLLGEGVRRDYRRGLALLSEAAMGDPHALERLAGLHLRGMGFGIERDPEKARRLFEAACDNGLWRAGREAARLLADPATASVANPTDPTAAGGDPARALLYMTFAGLADAASLAELLALRTALPEAADDARPGDSRC